MDLMQRGIEYRRLRAPREDGAVLAEPPLDMAGRLIEQNAGLRDQLDYDVQVARFVSLRSNAVGSFLRRRRNIPDSTATSTLRPRRSQSFWPATSRSFFIPASGSRILR
jgi:hypothetical protein